MPLSRSRAGPRSMPRIAHEVEPALRPAVTPTAIGSLARRAALMIAVHALAPACSAPTDAPALAEAIAPHEEAIERFSRWASRASVPSATRDPARFEETLFAPVRSDPRFVVVVVDRDGHPPLHLVHPPDAALPQLSLREVRTRRLGLLEAARDPTEPADVWVRVRADAETGLAITLRLRAPEP